MSLQGNLREFAATEILQLLASQRKTGCLVIEQGTESHCVHVFEGRIVSTRPGGALDQDPLYRFLRRVHRLSDEQLRGIATLNAESGRDLEDLIVQGRYLETEELGVVMERQILDGLTALIDWVEGRYRFEADRRWARPVVVKLSIEASLIEAARRSDERKRFTELFKDGRQIVSVRDLPDPDEQIADEESELFGIIDGQRTVTEVIAAAPLSDYEAGEALQRMIESGWVEFIGVREAVAPEAAPAPAAPVTEEPTPSNPLPNVKAWMREAAVAIGGIACLATLWVGAQALRPAERDRTPDTVFAAAQLRDVRLALRLYHREHAQYPKRLDDLVDDRWLERAQITIAGAPIHYRLDAQDTYQLDAPDARQPRHRATR